MQKYLKHRFPLLIWLVESVKQTATGTLNLGEVIAAAQTIYPDLAGMDYGWGEPAQNGSIAQLQYSVSEDQ